MGEVVRMERSEAAPTLYSIGFSDGLSQGERLARERYFWRGLYTGVVMVGLLVLAGFLAGCSAAPSLRDQIESLSSPEMEAAIRAARESK